MKKTNIVLGILAVAVIILYLLQFAKPKAEPASLSANDSTACCQKLNIAYIDVDSLLLSYDYSKELNEQLLRKRENSQANYNQKARQLESELSEFQRKYENNAFLSQERLQSEQQRLIQKQQDLQALDQRLSNELAEEMQKMNDCLRDSIYSYLGVYNKEAGYDLIFSNSGNDNIMIGNAAYNITAEILEGLNARYASMTK